MVEIHRERGHSTLEVDQFESLSAPTQRLRYDRGPVRLVITMSALSGSRQAAAVGLALSVLASAAFVLLLEFPDWWICQILPLMNAIFCLRVLLHPVRQERLEIDSRFVTVSYDGGTKGMWARVQFINPRLNYRPLTAFQKTRWGRGLSPRVVWGDHGFDEGFDFSAGVGSGLSKAQASRVVEEIKAFCAEHPPDGSVDFRGPVAVV